MTKRKRKLKNRILKGITFVMAILFVLSASAIDSPSWTPTIICAVSVTWLALVTYATELLKEERTERKERGGC